LCWTACAAKTVSPSSVGRKAYRRAFITNGRRANSTEVKDLRSEARELKECVAELTLENRLLKKSMLGSGDDDI